MLTAVDDVATVLARRRTGVPDDHRVAVVIEGGGSRATYSAGMAAALEDHGLTACVDAVYGVSAGSLNAAWLVGGMAREAMWPWLDRTIMRGTIHPARALRGGLAIDLRHLVEHVYTRVTPMPFTTILGAATEFHAVATDAQTGLSTDLAPLTRTPADLQAALRASSSIPVLAGPPTTLGARRFVDGGLAEPVAVHTALAHGATHLVVLRTHASGHECEEPPAVVDAVVRRWLRRHAPGVVDVWAGRTARIRETEALLDSLGHRVLHLRPPADAPAVSRTSTDLVLLSEALHVGHAVADAAFTRCAA